MNQEVFFQLKDGTRILLRSDLPDQDSGIHCLIHHGIGEHSGRYTNLKQALLPLGITVHSFDARGHGRSDGRRGDAEGILQYTEDLHEIILHLRQKHQKSFILIGHSMGGIIALDYGIRHPEHLTAVAATASGLSVKLSNSMLIKRALGRMIASFYPRIQFSTGLSVKQLSQDDQVIRNYLSDPLVHNKVSARMGIDLLEYGENVIQRAGKLQLPVFLAHGAADTITDPSGTIRFYENVMHPGKKLCIYPRMKHELHNEPAGIRERMLADLTDWIREVSSNNNNKF